MSRTNRDRHRPAPAPVDFAGARAIEPSEKLDQWDHVPPGLPEPVGKRIFVNLDGRFERRHGEIVLPKDQRDPISTAIVLAIGPDVKTCAVGDRIGAFRMVPISVDGKALFVTEDEYVVGRKLAAQVAAHAPAKIIAES